MTGHQFPGSDKIHFSGRQVASFYVRQFALIGQFIALGISEDRLSVQGLGEANPVASNDTRQGRMANRRVEMTVPAFQYEMIESVTK